MTQARGMGLFYERMDVVLGLLGIGLWILSVIALAAAVTYIVVRVSPGGDENARPKSQA
jgi:hypothetical protein